MYRAIQRLLQDVRTRLSLLFIRGILREYTFGEQGFPKAKVSLYSDDALENLDVMQQAGFGHKPEPGAQIVVLFQGGNRNHGVVIVTDDIRKRVRTLDNGETIIYSSEDTDETPCRVYLKKGRVARIEAETIEVVGNQLDVTANESALVTSPDVKIGGPGAQTLLKAAFRSIFNQHVHLNPNGTTTSTPIPSAPALTETTKAKGE